MHWFVRDLVGLLRALIVGAAALSRCFADASAALSNLCAAGYPVVAATGVVSCTSSSATSLVLSVSTIPAGCSGTCSPTVGSVTITPTLRACDETDWLSYYPLSLSVADGLIVSGAIASVWIIAWVWRSLVAALGSDGEDVEIR